MNSIIERLREKNPGLKFLSVFDDEFSAYGRVLDGFDCAELDAALADCPTPAEGNAYVASEPELQKLAITQSLCHSVFGEMPVQSGYCNGHGYTLNAEEYHKCSEINYSTTGLVLLLALPEKMRDYRLSSDDIVAFYLPAGVLVEIFPLVFHFAPCRISEEGFKCLVVLEEGTNTPVSKVDTSAHGEEKLLWMKNKWLICHKDSPQAQKAAYVGLTGENLKVNI